MNNFNFSPFPLIETKRLKLRQLKKTDSRYLFLMRNNPKVYEFLDRPLYKDLFETAESIEKLNHGISHNNWIFWAIENEDGKFIGTICLWNYNEEFNVSDIGFELDPDYWKQNYMDEATKAVVKFAFDMINLDGIWGFAHSENSRALNLLNKNNFKLQEAIEEVDSKGKKIKLSGCLLTKEFYKPSSKFASL